MCDGAEVTENYLGDLLQVLFPYFNQDKEKFKDIMTKSKPVIDEEMNKRISSALTESEKDVKESLAFSGLFKRLNFERCHGSKFETPNCSEFLLCVLALRILKRPATANQISILLAVIFPALLKNFLELKTSVQDVLSDEKEFVKTLKSGAPYYKINSIMTRNTQKLLEDFVKNTHNQEQLKKAFFDNSVLNSLLMSIDIYI